MTDYQAIADDILSAITDIIAGRLKQYTLEGNSYTYLDIEQLEGLYKSYLRRAGSADGGSSTSKRGFIEVNYTSNREVESA